MDKKKAYISKKKESYDIVIVGAGTGGTVAAITALKRGAKVCIIDKKREKKIGDKVCGDLMGLNYIELLEKEIGIKVNRNLIDAIFDKSETSSLENDFSFMVYEYSCIIKRHRFGQFLLKKAKELGAVLKANKKATEPIIENNCVTGVKTEDNLSGAKENIYGKVIIDASGALPAIRDKINIKGTMLENNDIKKSDFVASVRHIRELKKDIGFNHPKIMLSEKSTKGGYIWIFPYSKRKVNIGLGIAVSKDTPSLSRILEEYIASDPLFEGSRLIESGGGIVPTRRYLDSLVSNGFMAVGDAALQVNPMTGGGIGGSIIAGHIASKVATDAIKKGDVSEEALWDYNLIFTRYKSYAKENINPKSNYYDGVTQATLDVLRLFCHFCPEEDLKYILKNYIDQDMFKSLGVEGRFSLKPKHIVKFLHISARKPKVAYILFNFAREIKKIRAIYNDYPKSPEGFPEWKKKVDAEYKRIYRLLKIKQAD